MDTTQVYAELLRRSRDANLLSSCAGVLGWDERTYMPRQGSAFRGEQMALLARLAHGMLTDPHVVSSYLGGDLAVINRSGEAEQSGDTAQGRRRVPLKARR